MTTYFEQPARPNISNIATLRQSTPDNPEKLCWHRLLRVPTPWHCAMRTKLGGLDRSRPSNGGLPPLGHIEAPRLLFRCTRSLAANSGCSSQMCCPQRQTAKGEPPNPRGRATPTQRLRHDDLVRR